ncbi:MAG: helix-hairpin-helix domain-containing protein [Gammaproteobacteria bacterium]|nr:helix-hairpin-helix domain-containing protein [Gammaproteobacteria bacterium]
MSDSVFLHRYQFSNNELDELILSWFNLMSLADIDRFFWDYPGETDYSMSGYGLGRAIAQRIVTMRKNIGAFTSMQQILAINGIGKDKISDMRTQAKEAIALAEYKNIQRDPEMLWRALLLKGSGMTLNYFIQHLIKPQLELSIRDVSGYGKIKTTISIPFIGLARIVEGAQDSVTSFIRIRVEPWAFAVHSNKYLWKLSAEGYDHKDMKFTVSRDPWHS